MTGVRIEFALRRDEIFVRREGRMESALSGATNPRPYELALELAVRTLRRECATPIELRLRLRDVPPPNRVREWLRVLRAAGVAEEQGADRWRLVGGREAQEESPAELARAIERFRTHLGDDDRLGLRGGKTLATDVREEFHVIEQAFEREEHAEVVRRIEGRVGDTAFLTALVRGVSPKHRDTARFLAHTLAGMAAMNLAELDRADKHFADARATPELTRQKAGLWWVRLVVTGAAVHRMRAALVDGHAAKRGELEAALRAFEEARVLVADPHVDLLPEERVDLDRWALVERATPLTLLADLAHGAEEAGVQSLGWIDEATRSVADGQAALGRYQSPIASIASTGLLVARVALSRGDLAVAEVALGEAEELAERPSTPRWVAGWIPRYLADFAFAEGQGDGVLWRYIEDAWKANSTHRFQQMLLIARVGAFDLATEGVDLEIVSAMERLAEAMHTERHGVSFVGCSSGCSVRDPKAARRVLPRRIRCALGMSPTPIKQIQQLGGWR